MLIVESISTSMWTHVAVNKEEMKVITSIMFKLLHTSVFNYLYHPIAMLRHKSWYIHLARADDYRVRTVITRGQYHVMVT